MDLLCVWRFILGTVVVLKLMSAKDKLEKKEYMRMLTWGSEMTARMMSRFPNMVTRIYLDIPGYTLWTGRVQRGGAAGLDHLKDPE